MKTKSKIATLLGLFALTQSFVLVGCGGHSTPIALATIVNQTTTQTALAGNSATLTVTATGEELTYQWYRGSTPIDGATSAVFTLSNTTSTDSGVYYVVVSTPGGSVASAPIYLTITARTGTGSVSVN